MTNQQHHSTEDDNGLLNIAAKGWISLQYMKNKKENRYSKKFKKET